MAIADFTFCKEGLEALNLWREWFEEDGNPLYASEQGGDIHCFFCNAWVEHEPHEPDCIWVRAEALVKKVNDAATYPGVEDILNANP